MSPTRQEILDILWNHNFGIGPSITSGSEETEGSVDCECGWEEPLWSVEGECRCFHSLDEDEVADDCTCQHGRLVDQAVAAHAEEESLLKATHLSEQLSSLSGVGTEAALAILKNHAVGTVDEYDSEAYVRAIRCKCGFRKLVLRVVGPCKCGVEHVDGCAFEEKIIQAWGKAIEDGAHVAGFEHLADAIFDGLSLR